MVVHFVPLLAITKNFLTRWNYQNNFEEVQNKIKKLNLGSKSNIDPEVLFSIDIFFHVYVSRETY